MTCAVVLAAGRSERMGTQKLLLPLGDKPVIARVLDELSQSRVEQTLVVIGRDSERLRVALAGHKVQLVENPDPVSDMLGSLRCGLRALPTACDAVLVVLGDQPGITHQLIDELIRHFQHDCGKIIVPVCNGHRGHPVLFSSKYSQELLNHSHDQGLRGFLEAHSSDVSNFTVCKGLEDMDTPADYQRQEKVFSGRYADTVSPA